jgi:hypothetical protein
MSFPKRRLYLHGTALQAPSPKPLLTLAYIGLQMCPFNVSFDCDGAWQ